MWHSLIFLLLFITPHSALPAETPDLEEQTRVIATELRCVVCQNLSVADSPSEMAQQMRGVIRDQLREGKTPEEVKGYFVSKYGEWVLLAPSTKGFSLVVWVVPFVVLTMGLLIGLVLLRRWSTTEIKPEAKAISPVLVERVRSEATFAIRATSSLEDSSPRSELLHERKRLYADLKELEFDYQSGKLSETDYTELRRDIEFKAATVLQQLDRLPQEKTALQESATTAKPASPKKQAAARRAGPRAWQLAAGGVFLLLFGLTLGVMLTQSLRPRASEQDSLTGDFLTGTGSSGISGNEASSRLQEGRTAFAKQDWPKAIEAFKKVIAVDPNQPEAHAYMGFILVQAGHADGALMAFDKALSLAPNFPMALWGKGMTLYQAKQDYAGARA